ncbi:MAG TPA: aminotransferase class III-fold pyridoxal phosphate-dependent enzyme [Candidatus Xenobia bacterium]|jgi:putrescine aminotransferase
METLTEAEKITNEVYRDFIDCIDPSMEKEFNSKHRNPVEWEGQGPWLIDVAGNRFLDAATAGGVFGLGYRHPKVIEAVTRQLQRMPCSSRAALNPLQAKLARRLSEVTPEGLQYSHIAASGTESIEIALKVARLTTGRHEVVSTLGSFHGLALAATCVGGIPYLHDGVRPLVPGIHHVPYGKIEDMEKSISDKTCAVVLEPVQTAPGVIVPPDGYLKRIRELCDQHGALLIMDEIQTALRTGHFLACSHEGVVPDIACLGKVFSGGVMPVGIAIWNKRVQDAVNKKPFFNSTTFGGNQLTCAAVLAVLDIVEQEHLLDHIRKQGAKLRAHLDRLAQTFPKIYRLVEGRGMMQAVELADIKLVAAASQRLVRKHRLLVLHAVFNLQRMRINPPLNIEDPELNRIMEIIEDVTVELNTMDPALLQKVFDNWRQGIQEDF